MATETYIYGTIKTKDEKEIYIKDYYSNGRVIKFTLSDNPEENMEFSGRKSSKMGGQGPNYTPLMNIRNILRSATQTKYLKYKSISLIEEFLEPYKLKPRNLPASYYKYKEIKAGTRISIIDEANHKEFTFTYEPKPKQTKEIFTAAANYIWKFGTYKGKTIQEIDNLDKQYLDWILKEGWLYPNVRQHIINFKQYKNVK
jgi:uncharacterized protein (DUF3820 family)